MQRLKRAVYRGEIRCPEYLARIQGIARTLRPPYRAPEYLTVLEHNSLAVAALVHYQAQLVENGRGGSVRIFLIARDSRFSGRELGLEAMRRLRDHLVQMVPHGEEPGTFPVLLTAAIHDDNTSSQRLFARLGFTDTGERVSDSRNVVTWGSPDENLWEAVWRL